MGRDTSASNLDWEAPRSPSSLLTVIDQSRILGELPLKCFFQLVFPWDCQLQQHGLLGQLRHEDNVCSDEGNGFLGGTKLLCPHKSSAYGFSNGLKDLVMPPPVSSFSKCHSAAA
ncbi:hypothetical protein SRHO_G00269130 [Serrasalmus rhombeus]